MKYHRHLTRAELNDIIRYGLSVTDSVILTPDNSIVRIKSRQHRAWNRKGSCSKTRVLGAEIVYKTS